MSSVERKATARRLEAEYGKEFEQICHFIFEHPELGLNEHVCSAYLADYMRTKGFTVTMPFSGFETAFLAEYGSEGPTFDFLAEYDALPGYGADKHNGHACGHNWIAAATAGAAVVLAEMVKRGEMRAKIRLVGTPAEETYCTKVQMVEDGVFAHTDAAMQPHLAEETGVCYSGLAMNALLFHYRGKASHAAMAPWDGINALDSVQLLYAGLNALRQHIRPDVRIHGVIREGGRAANIVPESASALFYVRAAKRRYLTTVLEKVYNVAKGAALMTGAELEIEQPELPLDNLVCVPTLMELAEQNMSPNGITPTLTPEHAAERAGSTDVGNVSYACPTIYMEISLDSPTPVRVHEESALLLTDSQYAYDKLHQTILVLCGMTLDMEEDPSLIARAKREHAELIR